ncbi:hypothetical protein XENOCAPTIV_015481 [Xenoophorus captivus]|uniref:Uncharacterized protein n=1 Tax=Xenoophorus captivus TaxID=1517983 RepID=A0ABV0QIG7_9TELE
MSMITSPVVLSQSVSLPPLQIFQLPALPVCPVLLLPHLLSIVNSPVTSTEVLSNRSPPQHEANVLLSPLCSIFTTHHEISFLLSSAEWPLFQNSCGSFRCSFLNLTVSAILFFIVFQQ